MCVCVCVYVPMGGSRKNLGGPAKHSEHKSCSVKCFIYVLELYIANL